MSSFFSQGLIIVVFIVVFNPQHFITKYLYFIIIFYIIKKCNVYNFQI